MSRTKLKDIAHMRGLSQPMLFAIDTKNASGLVLVHCVRFETYQFPADGSFDETKFLPIHPDNDKRLEVMLGCIKA